MPDNSSYDPEAYRDFEHAAWEKLPHTYQEHFGFLTAQAAEPLLDAVGAAKGVRLLDVACGTGYIAGAAKARGAIAIGIDFVAGMVAEARKRHLGIEFRESDAEALPFAEQSFDAVVCNFGIHHFGQPDKAIAQAYRVLVPGGRYAFTAWCPPDKVKVNLRQIVWEALEAHGDPDVVLPPAPLEFSRPEENERVLSASGFIDAKVAELRIMERWSKPDHVLKTLYKGMGRTKARVEAQTDEAREKIENAVVESVKHFEKNGVIEIPMPAMLACARKP